MHSELSLPSDILDFLTVDVSVIIGSSSVAPGKIVTKRHDIWRLPLPWAHSASFHKVNRVLQTSIPCETNLVFESVNRSVLTAEGGK